ncbi:MAG: universal stress protein [Mycobacterium sp.]|nr:universal stress protein [Mycobacterium sp.]
MSAQETRRGIVVGVDASSTSKTAVEWAARDAEMRNVPLRVVHVVTPLTAVAEGWSAFPTDVYAQWQEDEARQILEKALKVAVEAAAPARASQVTTEVVHAPAVPGLVDLSREADMLVVGCRGEEGLTGALLGSVSAGVVHHAHCPVVVIHDEDSTPRSSAPVVVGVDGSPASEVATEIAFDEASRRGVELVALHAWTDMGRLEFPRMGSTPIEWRNIEEQEQEVLAERLSGWRSRYPDVTVRKVVVSDRPAPRLLEQAQDAQLVVVGSHGRGGFAGMLLGSVARTVVHSARVPVIVARA